MVIWLIGMSASGKTTIGRILHDKLSLSGEKWFFLDGDTFRNILGEDLGHSIEDRRVNAYRISRLCEFLNFQGVNVLACVLSIFHDNQKYNKNNIPNYKEVYIEVGFDELVKRDNKGLYLKALKGEIKDVVGVDIDFKPPYSPDLVIDNNAENVNFQKIVNEILLKFNIPLSDAYEYTRNSLLTSPHKYQYSKFQGYDFFLNHESDREKSIVFFKERLSYLANRDAEFVKPYCNNHISNGHLFLKNLLVCLLQGDYELSKYKDIILILIKRFEVGKKLYLTYDLEEIRKSSLEFKDYLNYPLFSLVLQKYYENEESAERKLIYLNAILKVNDIISSIKQDVILPTEIKYCIDALEQELSVTRSYI